MSIISRQRNRGIRRKVTSNMVFGIPQFCVYLSDPHSGAEEFKLASAFVRTNLFRIEVGRSVIVLEAGADLPVSSVAADL